MSTRLFSSSCHLIIRHPTTQAAKNLLLSKGNIGGKSSSIRLERRSSTAFILQTQSKDDLAFLTPRIYTTGSNDNGTVGLTKQLKPIKPSM
jgi:hypothetical protein